MQQASEDCWKSQKISSGKHHRLLPPPELNSVPFHVERLLFISNICLKLCAPRQKAAWTQTDRIVAVMGKRFEEMEMKERRKM